VNLLKTFLLNSISIILFRGIQKLRLSMDYRLYVNGGTTPILLKVKINLENQANELSLFSINFSRRIRNNNLS